MTLEILELVTFGMIPFWSAIKAVILFINWKPSMTEISYKISNVWIKQGLIEITKIEMINTLLEKFKSILPVVTSYLEQNPTLKMIIWYISNENAIDSNKKEF